MRIRLRPDGAEPLDIVDGRIAAPGGAPDAVLDLGAGALRAGLVNAHDHLHRNHFPRLGSPPYANAYAWGDDLHSRYAKEIEKSRRLPRRTALLFGAFKNVIGGVTAVVHHDAWEADFDVDFPLRVLRLDAVDSPGREREALVRRGAHVERTSREIAMTLHLAEGIGLAHEIAEVDALGLLDAHLLAVHVVGVDADGIGRLVRAGSAIVWCPTSNDFLYGRTAPAALLDSGLDVLLGTDALVSGEGTLLHELAAARRLGLLPDGRLEAAVTTTAARRLGLGDPGLAPGARADLVFLTCPLLEAMPRDVALVLAGGRPLLADESWSHIFEVSGVAASPMSVGGVRKWVDARLGHAAAEAFALCPETRRIIES